MLCCACYCFPAKRCVWCYLYLSTIIVYSPADNLSKIIIVLLDYIAHSHKHKHLVKTASEINYLLVSKGCLYCTAQITALLGPVHGVLLSGSNSVSVFCLKMNRNVLFKNLLNARNIDTMKRFCDIGETLYKSCGKVLTLRKINSLCAQHGTARRVLRHASKSLILHFAAAAPPVPVPVQLSLNSLYLQA